MVNTTAGSKPNGLATYFQTLWAPTEAFSVLSRFPMWGWAAIAGIVLTVAVSVIVMPASEHYTLVAQQQALQQMPADQRARAGQGIEMMTKFFPVFTILGSALFVWIGWLITAAVIVLAAALGGGEAKFVRAWVAALNLYCVYVVVGLINSVIIALRGPEAANSPSDLYGLPSLAYFVHGNPKLAAALYSFNLGFIWYYVVCAIALMVMMKLPRTAAIVATVVLALIGTTFFVVFAR